MSGCPQILGPMQADPTMLASPVSSFAELLERMAAIDQAPPIADGIACFSRMYRLVTEAAQQDVTEVFLGKRPRAERLDRDISGPPEP